MVVQGCADVLLRGVIPIYKDAGTRGAVAAEFPLLRVFLIINTFKYSVRFSPTF